MKIAIISPNPHHLQDMSQVLRADSHTVVVFDGGKSKMRSVAEEAHPELMLVDGMCCDPAELVQVEYVTSHFPEIAVILLCASQTPEFLINSMRVGVREVLPSPVSGAALVAAVGRIQARRKIGNAPRQCGKILAFMPCKGGSGATFLASNLGYQLAERHSVLLIDLNLQFGDALSFVHEGKPVSTLADLAHDITRLDASFLAANAVKVSSSYSVLAAPEDLSQAMEIKPEHIEAILTLAVKHYDFVLLDMPRTLDTLAIKALDRAYRIYPVLQAALPCIRNAKKLLAVFRSLGYEAEKVELIVNRHERGTTIGLDEIERTLGGVTLLTVPNSYKEVSASINQGNALVEDARSNAVARSLAEMALSLGPKRVDESRSSLLGRLFKRA
jgi:pilus assembly protein CpaE